MPARDHSFAHLSPLPHERGVATGDLSEVTARMASAWEQFIQLAERADFAAPSRRGSWTGREVVAHVGRWDAGRGLDDLLREALSDGATTVDQAKVDQAILDNHSDATREDILKALHRAREEALGWLASGEPAAVGLRSASSPLGPLPVLTVLHASIYQLAVAALDLEPCGVTAPPELLGVGLVALLDTLGGVAARKNVSATFQAITPESVVAISSKGGAWRTLIIDSPIQGPGVSATARDIVDLTSGRADAVGLYRGGRVAVKDMSGLLKLAPVIEDIPGVPAIGTMAKAVNVLGAVGGLLGRFGRR